MLNKCKSIYLVVASVILLLLTIVIAVVVPHCILRAGGTVSKRPIFVVDGINTYERITIPIKMKNGYSTPTYQAFNSDLSIQELCNLVVKNDENVKYEINGNNVYFYKEKAEKTIARASLHRNGNNGYLNYVLENMNINGIIFPTHLTEKYSKDSIELNGNIYDWYAVSFVTMDEMVDWLDSIGLYTIQINEQKDSLICSYVINGEKRKNIVYFNGNLIAVSQVYIDK